MYVFLIKKTNILINRQNIVKIIYIYACMIFPIVKNISIIEKKDEKAFSLKIQDNEHHD